MQHPQTQRLVPAMFFVLAAIGVVLILWFGEESTPLAATQLTFDRSAASQQAAEWLSAQGRDPAAFWSTTSFELDANAQSFLRDAAGRALLEERADADQNLAHWNVRFWQPLEPEQWSVSISPQTGRIMGFRHILPTEASAPSLSITAALALAQAAVPLPASQLHLLEQASVTQPNRVDHRFVWEQPEQAVGAASYRWTVVVQGDRVDILNEAFELPAAWQREGAWHARRGAMLALIGWSLTAVLTALVGLAWLQAAQRQRLRRRWALTLWLACLGVGMLVLLNSIPLELASYDVNQSLPAFLFNRLGGYVGQMVTITVTIGLAGMAGEALAWEHSGGAWLMSRAVTGRGLVSRPVVQALFVGGLVGVFQLGVISMFYALGSRWFGIWSPVQALYDDTLSTPFPPLYGLALGLLPAIGEELLFRMGGISVLTRWTGKPRLAIVLTALIWASLHATYPQRPFFIRMLELTLVGIGFGLLYWRFGVLASMAAHFTYNASLYVPLFFSGPLWMLILGVLAAAAVALLLLPALITRLRGQPLAPDSTVAEPLPPEPAALDLPAQEWPAGPQRRWLLVVGIGLAALVALALRWTAPVLPRSTTASGAIAASRQFAAANGLDLSGLYPSATAVADWRDIDLTYLRATLPDAAAAQPVLDTGQARGWFVRWSAWDAPESWLVDMGPDTSVLAFRQILPEDAARPSLDAAAAQARATAFFEAHVSQPERYALINAAVTERSARTDHSFTWQTTSPLVGDAYRRITIELAGDQISASLPTMFVPPEFQRRQSQQTLLTTALNQGPALLLEVWQAALGIIGLIAIARRKVPIRPWALLGLAGAALALLNSCLSLTPVQVAEAPRLIVTLSQALNSAVIDGSVLALLGTGAAALWQWAGGQPRLSSILRLQRGSPNLAGQIGLGVLAGLLWQLGRGDSASGAFASAAALNSTLPAARALIASLLATASLGLLGAGALALLGRWLPAWLAALLTTAGGLLLMLPHNVPSSGQSWLLLLPLAGWVWLARHNLIGALWGWWGGAVVGTSAALAASGGLTYQLHATSATALWFLTTLWFLWRQSGHNHYANPLPKS